MALILLLGITMLAVGLMFGISPFLALGYFLIAIHLLNTFWLNRVVKLLSLERKHESHAFLGDIVTVKLEIENRSNLPLPWFSLDERLPTQLMAEEHSNWLISLNGFEKRTLTYQLRAIKRGQYRLGPLEGSAGTIFPEGQDIAGESLHWKLTSFLTVYPLIVPLEKLGLPSRLAQGNLKTNRALLADPSRFSGVRDYVAGDDPRHINWSSSARLGRLQTKEYDRTQLLPLAIFLDLSRESYERSSSWLASECAVSVAASLANYAVRLGQSVGLYTNGNDPFINNPEGLSITEIIAKRRLQTIKGYSQTKSNPLLSPFKKNNAGQEPIPNVSNTSLNSNKTNHDEEQHIDIKIAPHTGTGQLTALLETLARVQLWYAPTPLYNLVNRWTSDLSWGSTVAIIAPKPSPELVNAMVRLRKSGFAVFSVFTEEAYGLTHPGGYSASLKALGFVSFDATSPEELNVHAVA